MRRFTATMGALVCALALPAGALASKPSTPPAALPIHHVTGTVTDSGWSSLTVQTSGRLMGVINALTRTASAITVADYTYVWGGGHAEAGVASVGIRGPGYNGHTAGFDCSGSVAAVLAGAGLWPAGSPVPNDAGVIHQLLQEHIIARGAGTPPDEVTLYDDPGVHIFMNIDGRFFGTSDGGGGGDRKGGAGWLSDGAPDASDRAFKRYHVLPSVLHDRTSYGHSLTFQTGAESSLAAIAQLGDRVRIGYTKTSSGTMTLQTLTWVGAVTTTGTVTAIAPGDAGLTIQTAAGQSLTLSTSTADSLLSGIELGDQVSVTYTTKAGILTVRALSVTAPPAVPTTGTTPTAPTPPVPPTDGTEGWNGGTDGWNGGGS